MSQHKVICFLSVALCAFFIATVILAVQKNKADCELSKCSLEKTNLLDIINRLNITTTTETPTDIPNETTTIQPESTTETEPPIISVSYKLSN